LLTDLAAGFRRWPQMMADYLVEDLSTSLMMARAAVAQGVTVMGRFGATRVKSSDLDVTGLQHSRQNKTTAL
jgi:hypothetical protein